MRGGDLIFMARRRAGLTQRELAERLGYRQATIARWERGDRRPSFEEVEAAAGACDVGVDVQLVPEDRSWWPQVAAQLELDPLERVRRLAPANSYLVGHLAALAAADAPAIVIGELAGALHGWPLTIGTDRIEVCARAGAQLPEGVPLTVIEIPPGTQGYGDLGRAAERIELHEGRLLVAGLLDLLRIADASPARVARRHALALRAVVDVERARDERRAGRHRPRSDEQRLAEWLSRQTPVGQQHA